MNHSDHGVDPCWQRPRAALTGGTVMAPHPGARGRPGGLVHHRGSRGRSPQATPRSAVAAVARSPFPRPSRCSRSAGTLLPPPSPGSRGALALASAAPRPRGASTASVPGAFLLSQQRFWRSRVKPTSRSLFPRARSCLAFSVSCPAFPLHASVPQAHARTREAGRTEAG